jgi:hypothetical protein
LLGVSGVQLLSVLLLACRLDDDIWEIRYNFPSEDNLKRILCSGDNTVLNLLALIEGHGYGFGDKIYYVKGKSIFLKKW